MSCPSPIPPHMPHTHAHTHRFTPNNDRSYLRVMDKNSNVSNVKNGQVEPLGSKIYLKSNFTKDSWESLQSMTKELGSEFEKPYMPEACQKMSPSVRKGLAAFEGGIDYLPDVPVCKFTASRTHTLRVAYR